MCFDAILPGGEETRIQVLSTVDKILIGECLGITEQTRIDSALSSQALLGQASLGQTSLRKQPSPIQGSGVSIPPIALFQGLPRGTRMDLIVRQAAESEVSVIAPFESDYSMTHIKKSAAEKVLQTEKIKRWERIIKEGRQQSGSVRETEIRPPCKIEAVLEFWKSIKSKYQLPVGILLHQEPLEKGSFHDYLCNCPDYVALAVGPEGGFSPREVSLLMEAGFKPLIIGNSILRTETAALYGIAIIRILLLESELWKPRLKG